MSLTDLGVPAPRPEPLPYEEFIYECAPADFLPVPDVTSAADVLAVLSQRRTRRRLGRLGRPQLSALLWHSAKRRDGRRDNGGLWDWQSGPSPSAGGCHPIDVLVATCGQQESTLRLYDPYAHAIQELLGRESSAAEALAAARREVLPDAAEGAIVLWFAAQPARTLRWYERGDSLIWRDSGALLATIGLVAEALGLCCCGLGITGEPWLSRSLNAGGRAVGVGGCIVGRR